MGVNLWNDYHEIIDNLYKELTTEEWYKKRDQLLDEMRLYCPHYMIYPGTPPNHKRDEVIMDWCDENLDNNYFAAMEVEIEPGRREWIICFEEDEDAMAFKLRWI